MDKIKIIFFDIDGSICARPEGNPGLQDCGIRLWPWATRPAGRIAADVWAPSPTRPTAYLRNTA